MRHLVLGLAVALLAMTAVPACASAAQSAPAPPRVMLAMLPVPQLPIEAGRTGMPAEPNDSLLYGFARRRPLSIGLLGATQGSYDELQALLDISQGTRVSLAEYDPKYPLANMRFTPTHNGAGRILAWSGEVARAQAAPAGTTPGLLGSAIPGGVGFAGVSGRLQDEAIVAANTRGHIAAVSIGSADSIVGRAQTLLGSHRLVVAALPTRAAGQHALDRLLRARTPNELLVVMQSPPILRSPQMLPTGIVGLGPRRQLTSESTHLGGIVAGIDLAPTILKWLKLRVPDGMKGEPIKLTGDRPSALHLLQLDARLKVVQGRRFAGLEAVFALWLAVGLALGIIGGKAAKPRTLRLGSLAIFWVLSVVLVTASFRPVRSLEFIILAVGSFLLAALTDRFVPWPRAVLVPCGVTVLFYMGDLVGHSYLIIRSLLGPNPRFGSRFYGLGNELEAALGVLWLLAVGALLDRRERTRGSAAVFAVTGIVIGAVFGSARLGADVGGVITVGAGAVVATIAMLPGRRTWRAAAAVIATPFVALAALALLDVVTGANGHYTRTVLHAHGSGALDDIVKRRYTLAFNVFKRGLMPFATIVSLMAVAYAVRHRARLLRPVADRPGWSAALWGALAASVAGSLGNDSGPELLVIGTFVIAFGFVYVRGDPRLGVEPDSAEAGG